MPKRRKFTPEFKTEVVLEALNVETSQAELCRRHNITAAQLAQWKQQFLENTVSLFESRDKLSDAETARIAELEQQADRLRQAIDCTAIVNLDHCLNQECATIAISPNKI